MGDLLLCLAAVIAAAVLVDQSIRLAGTARQAHPDQTDYQARFEADRKKEEQD